MEFSYFFFSLCKRCQVIVLLRICRIKEIRIFLHLCLNAFMYKCTADQFINRRIPCCFFSQGSQSSLFIHISSVNLAKSVIIAIGSKRISHNSAILHSAQAWFKINSHMGIRTACRMLCIVTGIPRSHTDGNISFLVFYLSEPGHIAACCFKKSIEHNRRQLCFPCIWNQYSLLMRKQCIPAFFCLFKRHLSGPQNLLYMKPFFL